MGRLGMHVDAGGRMLHFTLLLFLFRPQLVVCQLIMSSRGPEPLPERLAALSTAPLRSVSPPRARRELFLWAEEPASAVRLTCL
jgi:hypothetical protein